MSTDLLSAFRTIKKHPLAGCFFVKKEKNYGLHYTQNYKKWLNYAKTGKIPADDPTQRKPDITLAKTKLDWEPKINLNEGQDKTIEYFKTQINLFK